MLSLFCQNYLEHALDKSTTTSPYTICNFSCFVEFFECLCYIYGSGHSMYTHVCRTRYSRPGQVALCVIRHAVHRHTCTHSHAYIYPHPLPPSAKYTRCHDCQVTCHTHSWPHPPTTHAYIMYLTVYIAVCCRQCMHPQHTHVYTI